MTWRIFLPQTGPTKYSQNYRYVLDGGRFPATPLLNLPGNAVMQQEVGHKVGHMAQEAGQAELVDVQGQAVANTWQNHHSAPVDAALKQVILAKYS